jgi:zinc D-Ala-D-Ala carboxypeptidase
MLITDWDQFANFKKKEFDCKHTGLNLMQQEFVDKLQALRNAFGKPIVITSGYRHPTHPTEAVKASPGWHSKGLAADIACESTDAYKIVKLALTLGFTGIGISQRQGAARFVHLDLRDTAPLIYSY